MEKDNKKNWYDKSYKLILIIPAILILLSVSYLIIFNEQHGDVILKDVSLTGGTEIEFNDPNVNIASLEASLVDEFPDISIRGKSDIRTGQQTGVIVKTVAEASELQPALEEALGYKLAGASIKKSNPGLSGGFYKQLRNAILLSFLLMAVIVFIIFRKSVPSLAVILSAFADIIMTIAVVNLLGIKLSLAGITAFLLLIGYSVDTDILLTTRALKRHEGSVNSRMYGAFKTGFTMTITSIAAVAVTLVVIFNSSEALRQIFIILLVGLGFDLLNTWLMNASIIKWYVERKKG